MILIMLNNEQNCISELIWIHLKLHKMNRKCIIMLTKYIYVSQSEILFCLKAIQSCVIKGLQPSQL